MDTADREEDKPRHDEHSKALLPVEVALEYSDRVNFAMQQNGVPLIDLVRLTSSHDQPLENLKLDITLGNDESQPWTTRVSRIDPGSTVSITPDTLGLSAKRLAQRTEAEKTEIICRVTTETKQTTTHFPCDLLAFDQWPGIGHYPELTAAFVTPNHPKIAEFLGSARQGMQQLSGSDAFDGYQSGSRQRVSQMAEACFNALFARDVGYINPPASFEIQGQRVRLVDRIAREGFGTCLDLSLLLMSMWEQCGLHTLVLLPEGHAMPALWTHDTHMPETAIDEPARIRNLIELGEIIPVESTHLTHSHATFSQAVAAAKEKMADPGSYFYAIDIRASRKHGIRPLPLRVDGESGVDIDALDDAGPTAAATSTLDRIALAERADIHAATQDEDADENTSDRITRWQTKLLDLTLRNRLLNFKPTGRTLPLNVPDLAGLEDKLADSDAFEVRPRSETAEQFLRDEIDSKRIYADEPPAETAKRLLNLYRLAKSSIEETGANVLYLTLGLLKWYESEHSEQERLAPLVLLPINLTRSASGSGYNYRICLSDEPLRPNVTLLEKLRVEFGIETGGLDDLPEDESGLDIDLILRNFRAGIRDMPRWEVVESAAIGLFSFNKFLMWKDLRENIENLKKNRLVSHLVDRPTESFDTDPLPQPEALDDDLKPDDLLCTRDADSSQMAAIRAASERKSFVLEGPPGTGKSQTIANMIADTLARGRTVLFVAEKMAALSVVRKRLEDDGLGTFCLELHSAKASKKEVLAQLERSLFAANTRAPAMWDSLCEDLTVTRSRLNNYVREMHHPRPTGETLYQVLGRLSLVGDGPRVKLSNDTPETTSQEQLDRWIRHLALVMQRGKPIDPAGAFPLRGIGRSYWSYSLPDQAKEALNNALEYTATLRDMANAFLQSIGCSVDSNQIGEQALNSLAQCAIELDSCTHPPSELVFGSNAKPLRQRLLQAIEIGRPRDDVRTRLLSRYREEFLDIDTLVHIDAVKRHLDRPGILRFFTAGGVKKSLRIYAKDRLPDLKEVLSDLELVRSQQKETDRLREFVDLATLLGSEWNSTHADWGELDAKVQWADKFNMLLDMINSDQAMGGIAESLSDIAASETETARTLPQRNQLIAAWRAWQTDWQALQELLAIDVQAAIPTRDSVWLSTLETTLSRWLDNLGELNTWCSWREARDHAASDGLAEIIALYESQGCTLDELDKVFWRSFGKEWFNAVADKSEAVRTFNANAHSDTIDRFEQLDKQSIRLTRDVINARLSARAPDAPENASSQSEIGILRRELQKKSRHKPTRRLIEAMPTLLPRLKPCFLMSPLSVAQFLDTNLPPFDLVVFDEASQIPVWDAIGAIARGAEVIVVGDSKQLPPTAFFNNLDSDDDVDEDDHAVDDMESILKECNASGIPGMRLRWHYRSRHESLIAFSNHHYYENELHTFPSPEERSEQLGVTFRHVPESVYDRGGSRTNRIEAERVVDEVIRMLEDPSCKDSIGIVTFSKVQQALIEDMLDAKRREMPDIEPYFTKEVPEPVFVKNLENVQGDERDAIIFSICYGLDQHGKDSMNFGPLNKEGGERRLNVAITRARRKLIVFSSLTSDQIDLRRTRAVGVRHFKTFLDYANRGPQAIAEAVEHDVSLAFDSGFERAVYNAITEKGWQLDTQVGCAGYRVDLAVRHPDKPGKYLIGIECDGATYHSAKTARDRDRIRQSVLEGLGWRIERVWSTDWWVNPKGCMDKVLQAIDQVINEPEPLDLPEHEMPSPEEAETITASQKEDDYWEPEQLLEPTSEPEHPIYTPAKLRNPGLSGQDFYEQSATTKLATMVEKIIDAEAPITKELIMRRIAHAFDIRRITDRYRQRVQQILDGGIQAGQHTCIDEIYWDQSQDPSAYDVFRVPGNDPDSERDIDDIPTAELVNTAAHVLAVQFGLPRDELARETARLYGINRLTSRVSTPIDTAIDQLIASGKANEFNGTIRPTHHRE